MQDQPNTQESIALLKRLPLCSPGEQQQILASLLYSAQHSNEDEDWNIYALALQALGRLDEAIAIWQPLVETHPDNDICRLNLGCAYARAGQLDRLEMSEYHLRYLAEHGSTEDMRNMGRQNLEAVERDARQKGQPGELQQLQLESLREAIETDTASADDYVSWTKLSIQSKRAGDGDISLTDLVPLLEKGRQCFPQSAEILEQLIFCYLQADPEGKLEEVLKELEVVAPDSPVLQYFESIDDDTIREYRQQMDQRIQELMERANLPDPALQTAAVRELHNLVSLYPANFDYHMAYAFALNFAGRDAEAIQQGEEMEPFAGESHSIHFNLGQLFWLSGDATRGQQHLDLAVQYAQDEQERQDALARIASLSKGAM